MKKIAISGIANAASNFQTVTVTITEQTHRNEEFGKDNSDVFRAKDGFELRSAGCPARYSKGLYVRGNSKGYDKTSVEVPAADYPRLLQAVKEYNEAFKTVEPRHIVATFSSNPADNFQTVKMQITSQTHIGSGFSDRADSKRFLASNGITLASVLRPEAGYITTYLLGTEKHNDSKILLIPAAQVPKIKEAIKEYNRTYAAHVVIPQHITIDATSDTSSDFQTVKVQIKEQTCVLDKFGTPAEKSKGAVGEFIHGKIRLASCADDKIGFKKGTPTGVCASKGLIGTFYMLPKATYFGSPETFCTIPADVFPHLKEAIEEFNKQFAGKKYVKRLNYSLDGVAVGEVVELVEKMPNADWKVKTPQGVRYWNVTNAVEVPAPAKAEEVTVGDMTTVG